MAQGSPIFQKLRLIGWRQFDTVDIEFHPRLTILTGANGAGKSTILNLLSSNLGVARPYLSVPQKMKEGAFRFFGGLFEVTKRVANIFPWSKPSPRHFGELVLSNGSVSAVVMPDNVGLAYDLVIDRQPILGFHVPSHRLLPTYQSLPDTIATSGVDPDSAFEMLLNENYTVYRGGHTNSSIIFRLKQILTAWKFKGEGNSIVDPDPVQKDAYDGFITILKKVLPPDLGFEGLLIRLPDVLLQTKTGTFLIDAASGGLVTIIEIAAIIYACSIHSNIKNGPFIVTFDEPENHLHPALQRTLLPTLLAAFPMVQFVVATHSPFMVSSLKDSNVYVLRYIESEATVPAEFQLTSTRRVETVRLDYANRAGTAGEILRDVLGVPVTLPSWVEESLTSIVRRYESRPVDAATVDALRADLKAAGLAELLPEALPMLGRKS